MQSSILNSTSACLSQNGGKGWNKVRVGGRTNIFFETTDIKHAIKELKEKGVKFTEEISKRAWGEYKAVFIDPDGNEFNLIEAK